MENYYLKTLFHDIKEKFNDSMSVYELDELRKKYKNKKIQIADKEKLEKKETFLYICPDLEWEFPYVFELINSEDNEENKRYMGIIYDGILEYYQNSDFHDTITGLGPVDFVLLLVKQYNIPLVQYWSVANTELINLTRMRKEV